MKVTTLIALVSGGRLWSESSITTASVKKKWVSECGEYEILSTAAGKFRLVAFEHEPSSQFPDAGFWMREYATLGLAAHQAEVM